MTIRTTVMMMTMINTFLKHCAKFLKYIISFNHQKHPLRVPLFRECFHCNDNHQQTHHPKSTHLSNIIISLLTMQHVGSLFRPGIKPTPPALEVQSLNHRTIREVPKHFNFHFDVQSTPPTQIGYNGIHHTFLSYRHLGQAALLTSA